MTCFIDLHLRPSTLEQASEMAVYANQLGYRCIASTKPVMDPKGFTVANRIDIDAKRGRELQDALKKNRRNYDIISVRCLSKEVARTAAKDDRVDILLFPDDPTQRKHNWLDHHEAVLMEGTGRAYEVNASDFLASSPTRLSKIITQIKRDLIVAQRYDIPVVFSSGASTPLAMREPKALTALATLLDVDEEYAADMLSTTPLSILERNHSKMKKVS
jgi:RNase P/RNase MRP subunit p30